MNPPAGATTALQWVMGTFATSVLQACSSNAVVELCVSMVLRKQSAFLDKQALAGCAKSRSLRLHGPLRRPRWRLAAWSCSRTSTGRGAWLLKP